MLFDLNNQTILRLLAEAEFGIERESLRVNLDGTLAQSKHPFAGHRNIDRDFCENQIEIIGDVFTSPDKLNTQLEKIGNEIDCVLAKNGELLWPFSNPPRFGTEDEIPVAEFVGNQRGKSEYRQYLAEKYGKKKMLFSGIHLNFSFSEALIRSAFEQSGEDDLRAFKDNFYMRLSKRLTQYAWLIVFLTAASPIADKSLGIESGKYSSARCSEQGYWNTFTPILDYSSLRRYVGSIADYIVNGDLKAASELYYPVRIKPRGANSLEALLQNGINHLELRVFDVNPLSRTGIFTEDIRFVHLLMIYLSSLPDFEFDKTQQEKAIDDIKSAAEFRNAEIKQRAAAELDSISLFISDYLPEFNTVVEYQKNKLKSGGSYAEIINGKFKDNYMKKGLELARSYQRSFGDV